MPFSLRLDSQTEALLRRLAKTQGRSKSAVVREAVEQYGNRDTAAAGRWPYCIGRRPAFRRSSREGRPAV